MISQLRKLYITEIRPHNHQIQTLTAPTCSAKNGEKKLLISEGGMSETPRDFTRSLIREYTPRENTNTWINTGLIIYVYSLLDQINTKEIIDTHIEQTQRNIPSIRMDFYIIFLRSLHK